MKINYDFYTGNDSYCDGDTEKDVISYLKEYGEEGYAKIFEKDIRWPVYYHITPIRKNILKWYPFKENAEVLEIGAGMGAITNILCDKATHVTAVELSKQRASAIIERCQDKNNLELIIGNFNDIKFDKKFDYITLIGVLEYAPLYTNSDNPFKSFLDYIKTLLKDDGKLLIAIENQMGIKYFSGAPEDHTGKIFDGITGYENKNGIRTFGKLELTNLLKNSGFDNTKFYYPLPDYKLPTKIFSDEYMPNDNTINDYTPYVANDNFGVIFDEKKVYSELIKNNMFENMANSFFVEASSKKIDTFVDLEKENENLYKIDEAEKKFFDEHYFIKGQDDMQKFESSREQIVTVSGNLEVDVNKSLIDENKRLQDELNKMANSWSWKVTKPVRDFRTKYKNIDK